MKTASWVVRNKATGAVVLETYDKKVVAALNTAKYEAVPILQHLQEINRKVKATKDNPMPTAKKKPTPAQVAARKLFAQRAKAGTLGGKVAAKNPAPKKTKRRGAINSTGYGVIERVPMKYRVQANGPAGFGTVADFAKLDEAEAYGRAYANMSGVQVRIVTK